MFLHTSKLHYIKATYAAYTLEQSAVNIHNKDYIITLIWLVVIKIRIFKFPPLLTDFLHQRISSLPLLLCKIEGLL